MPNPEYSRFFQDQDDSRPRSDGVQLETGRIELTTEQMRELARKLQEMLRRDLQIERDRFGKSS